MVTASIVLYNTRKEQLITAINSYRPSEKRKLYLIDNSCNANDTYQEFASNDYIYYICNKTNVGYGAANNIGIKKAIGEKSDYHIVLNPDLRFESCIIDKMIEYADEHIDVVYMMPKVISPNGDLQYLCKLLPTPGDLIIRRFFPQSEWSHKKNDRYVLKNSRYDHIMNPPCLSGCFMFMRTEALVNYNLLFDERFFMYCEDFDLIRRLHRIGKTLYYPSVYIIHDHKKESYKNIRMLIMHVISACKYFNKYGWFIDKERDRMNTELLENEGSIMNE